MIVEPFVILCIEDEVQLRRDIVDELVEAGYDVLEASNGKQALDKLARVCPDLILCDISMPELDGYGVLNALQERGADYAEIPFVFLSALADPRHIVDGKRLGADDYLVKPIDYDLLLATIEARLRQIGRIRLARPLRSDAPNFTKFSEVYGLTPAELRITQALTQGSKLAQIATDLGVSRSTVAFHMRNIFQKTETGRQTELVALVLKR
ncbi:DNA-binding NarL/FixJ family response regulator [Paenochrobactrum gallinarii]|uniref:Flagellar transcriptional regulator FtcR n=1 Tax=Paenochrobactrum gallinarii TaxID=643673 RepID=A0A841M687_9HYPH|nr:response regulator transcription factor [Paenochrobactrum gallinarii]MBB6261084.1 DNA-binding NarL/FixJ family response regulator [Paenochrobactrum gallinarii]